MRSEERTFIKEGNKSLCVKYESRLVWYAPDVIDRATSTAFWRMSTMIQLITFQICVIDNARVLPALMVTSRVATNSVNMASTWSRPASTLIMSELGFAYFFVRIEAKNAVKVYLSYKSVL
jgi:hypothetical protein